MPENEISEYTHKQALARMAELNEEIERMGNKTALSSEDETRWHEYVGEIESLDTHRRGLERESDRARLAAIFEDTNKRSARGPGGRVASGTSNDYDTDPLGEPDSVEEHRFRNPWDLSELRMAWRSGAAVGEELRSRALSAIERMPGANDKVRARATQIIEEFDDQKGTIARQALLTSNPDYMRAFAKLAKGQNYLLNDREKEAVERAMSLTDGAGGYLVPFQLDPTVILTATGSLNEIRSVARQVVATGDVWHGIASDGVSWSWDGEAVEVSDDSPTIVQPVVNVFKAAGFVPITLEALQDEANVTQEVAKMLAFGKDTLEASAFITGTGSTPQGIVTALTGGTSVVAASTPGTFTDDDVFNLDGQLPARYRRNASWLAHRITYNSVRAFDTARGGTFWTDLNGDVPPALLSRRACEAEAMDSTISAGTSDNYLMVYGDFSNYVIADRVGMTVEFIPHLLDPANNRPNGQRGWYAYYRVGADSVNDKAFRMLNVHVA